MDHGNWEIGFNSANLDALLGGEQAAMTLWFLAGYLQGLADGNDLHSDDLRMVLKADGETVGKADEKLAPSPSRRRHDHQG